TVSDIKKELAKGNLVIVPINGQRIGNPNFTAPGPLTHMFPILGYDSATDEFIVNDPGTRQGAGYRYSSSAVEASLQDYPSGATHGYQTPGKTAMLVVEK
ncbi:MAG: C39 family peptidase, partial [Patescibacteria group bacterium]